jgi:NAD(P)-dependent dehydrogenase (short-subunit alcohol dehydrogenase family)
VHDLEGKVAVVTGAASGIGRSLAGRLSVEGMHVVLADVEEGALRDAVAGIGGEAVAFTTDVTSMASVEALAEFAYATFGAVHVLANNAGVFQGGLMWECTDADFEWTFGVNTMGIVHGVRAFVPRMLQAGTDGHVVNTVSMAGLATTPFSGPYDVSKFAAMAATECLAHDLASVGAPIAVSAVCPGLVDTGISRSRRNRPEALDGEQSDSAAFVEQALADGTAGSMSPAAVADLILDAIRTGDFLVPTRPSYARQLTDRTDDLVARTLPRSPMFD